MTRRRAVPLFVVATAAVVALAAPGSSTPASAADDAATVDGQSISIEEFEALMDAAGSVVPEYAADPATDTVSAERGRELLRLMILNRVRPEFLEQHGIELSDGDRAAAEDAVAQSEGPEGYPEPLRSELVDDLAYSAATADVPAPDEDQLAALYRELPASTGVLCLNVISIAGDDADEAADALRDGDAPRDVVAAAGNGSRLQDECFSLGELSLSVPGLFRDLVALRPGELLDPIATSNGHQILQVPLFDDIAGELVDYFADPPVSPDTGRVPSAGELLLMGYTMTADVSVNPRYGRWDATTADIVPLGQE